MKESLRIVEEVQSRVMAIAVSGDMNAEKFRLMAEQFDRIRTLLMKEEFK